MAGQMGRSGGQNRLTVAERRLKGGTTRRTSGGEVQDVDQRKKDIEDMKALRAFHRGTHDALRALDPIGKTVNYRALRELRATAVLMLQLSIAIGRLEADLPVVTDEDSRWAKFFTGGIK